MATLTKEQIEQKLQQLKQLNKEMITITTEDLLIILRTQPGLSLDYNKFVDKGTDAPQQLGRKSPFS